MSLFDDLQADRHRAPVRVLEARERVAPAVELRLTPLRWTRPQARLQPGGLALAAGPYTVVLVLRR